jgi:protein O-GlcNAc transferase
MPDANPLPDLLEQVEEFLLAQRPREAAALALSILAVAPDDPRALHLAGLALAITGDPEAAAEYLTRAIDIEPYHAGWSADLAAVLFSAARVDEAEEWGIRALAVDSQCLVAHSLLAVIASRQGRDHRARNHLRALAAQRPGDQKVRARLALAEYAVGDFAETMRLLRELIDSGLANRNLHSEYVSALLYDPAQTRESLRRGFEEWAARSDRAISARAFPPERVRSDRKLRIGYLSGEFAATPSRHFLLPIFRHHDRDRFEITCYHARNLADAHTDRFRELADRWRNCADMSDEVLADRIEADEIDILTDLSGHLRRHRLAVFALQPAPVQVAYPNHPATTGIAAIRYMLTDRWVCPEGSESQYTEEIYRLARGYLVYEPPVEAPAIGGLPCDQVGTTVFGLFQRPAKLNSGVWDAVAGVLTACPNSRLLVHHSSIELDEPDSPAREGVELALAERGIDPARVFYDGWRPLARHLELLGEADIALDTFPYNGATTTCECLWMGVPVVTVIGSSHAARVGYELLDRIGLTDLAATSTEKYVETAVTLAQDGDRLRSLRCRLRDLLRQSTLVDPQPLVREIEGAYQKMWGNFVEENR